MREAFRYVQLTTEDGHKKSPRITHRRTHLCKWVAFEVCFERRHYSGDRLRLRSGELSDLHAIISLERGYFELLR